MISKGKNCLSSKKRNRGGKSTSPLRERKGSRIVSKGKKARVASFFEKKQRHVPVALDELGRKTARGAKQIRQMAAEGGEKHRRKDVHIGRGTAPTTGKKGKRLHGHLLFLEDGEHKVLARIPNTGGAGKAVQRKGGFHLCT